MPTVYQCIVNYCEVERLPMLSKKQRCDIGAMVAKEWKLSNEKITGLVKSREPEDDFWVVKYPIEFSETIFKMIEQFIDTPATIPREKLTELPKEPPKKKERKRIPAKPKPAYTLNK